MHKDDGFRDAVDQAEMDANECVEDALFAAAVGGNVTAQQVWLYNRAPERWKDRRNIRVGGEPDNPIDLRTLSDEELLRRASQFANRLMAHADDSGSGAPLNRLETTDV